MSNRRVTEPGTSTSRSQRSVRGADPSWSVGEIVAVRPARSSAVTWPSTVRMRGNAWRSAIATCRGSIVPLATSGSSGV